MDGIFTLDLLYKLICAGVASIAFAIILKVAKRHLLFSCIGAMMTYLIYFIANSLLSSLFVAAFVSAMFTSLYAEVLARLRRAPTIVFALTGVIPTVPGGDLYHAMRELITGNVDAALGHFVDTVEIGLGIAGGIVAMSVLFGLTMDMIKRIKCKLTKGSAN